MRRHLLTLFLIMVCASLGGAQSLSERYVACVDSADRHIAAGRWRLAEADIVNALRTEPANKNNYLLWSNLGLVRMQLDDLRGAVEAFDIGLVSAPNSTVLLANRGRALLSDNRPVEARADFEKLLSLRPDDPVALEGLADICMAERNPSDAANLYAKVVGSDVADPHLEFKFLLALLQADRVLEAADEVASALVRFPDDPNMLLVRSAVRYAQHLHSESEADLKLALRLGADPQLADMLLGSGRSKR